MSEKAAQEGKGQAPEQHFVLQKIYVKDLSFETPASPQVFTREWRPDINVELHTSGAPVGEGVHEVVLRLTVTAKLEDSTAFLVEVNQAGIFTVTGFGAEETARLLGSYCPSILFPYAREVVSDLVTRGGFPQLLLAPVNFEALYEEHLARQRREASSQEPPVH